MSDRHPPASKNASWASLVRRFIHSLAPDVYRGVGIVIAVSGGADSVALLRLIVDAWGESGDDFHSRLTVAHFNHGLRGQASDDDQRFTASLAEQLRIGFVTATASRPPQSGAEQEVTEAPSDEATLRRLRYDFLLQAVAARGARCVLTAHNADDQVETVLHHLFRGTGPTGLCGIPRQRPIGEDFMLIRPLLGFRGDELRGGLRQICQSWREDHTNRQTDYQRNWLRGELLPLVRSRYPDADDAVLRLAETQRQWHASIGSRAARWLEGEVSFGDDEVRIRRREADPSVLGLAIGMIWDRMGWRRGSLAADHYVAVRSILSGERRDPVTLPGSILVKADGASWVTIRKVKRGLR
jgi:tRNA(Ile)-lysidine synthase